MRIMACLGEAAVLLGYALPVSAQNDPATSQGPAESRDASPLLPIIWDRSRAVAARNEVAWMARIQQNHPVHARLQGIGGRVGVTVTVNPDGRPTDCEVTRSSGYEILDTAACLGMQRYARFDPAPDQYGIPISAEFSTEIFYPLN